MNNSLYLLALSGGVDSAVAGRLILEKHQNIIGVSHRHWPESRCCSTDCLDRCAQQCADMNIPYFAVDCIVEFTQKIVENFVQTYQRGETPNPCVLCNPTIRFDLMVKKIFENNPSLYDKNYYIVTGHYAQVSEKNGLFYIKRGRDLSKDQSYMLYRLSSEQISRCVFPLGDLFKKEVRAMAEEWNLRSSKQKDSQDICFVKESYRQFLKEYTQVDPQKGDFITQDGTKMGEHEGVYYYTRGQRRGLGLSGGPWYVIKTDIKKNTVSLGSQEDLKTKSFYFHQSRWINPNEDFPLEADIQLRYHTDPIKCLIEKKQKELYYCRLEKDSLNVTSGQSAVVYRDDCVLGGGMMLYDSH